MAKDFFKNELAVGDIVAFCELNYRNFSYGKIEKITDKMVILSLKNVPSNRSLIPSDRFRQFHDQVIKVPDHIQKHFN